MQLVTGNHAAGHSMSLAGEANRNSRGAVCGIYPITPQTEIVEYIARYPFTKGRVIPAESEHSAMGVCIGAALNGARTFTASSSNGLAYMAENVMVAAFYRLPIVMVAVNRTLGPPWNIWADQGDSLLFRDFAWIQLYCDTSQDVADTTMLAFRLAEDPRVLLPVMVCMDAFIVSHTSMEIELTTQEQTDRYLPPCKIPHRLDPEHPVTVGGMAFPQETLTHRLELDEAMRRVPDVLEEHRQNFKEVFGREVAGAVTAYRTEDADRILIVSASISTTVREVIDKRRERGEKVGMIRIKLFRPFPGARLRELCANVKKIGVLDRNYAAGTGGIFYSEVLATLQGQGDHLVQGYLTGIGGGDVIPKTIHEVIEDLTQRTRAGDAVWKGIDP
jgi:pyruvate/2-oxoacid:ferredoxin oxidoreductase alpha subunit